MPEPASTLDLLKELLALVGTGVAAYLLGHLKKAGEERAVLERVEELTEKVEGVKSTFTKELELLRQIMAFDREDYGLFAQRRNEVYFEVFGLYEKATGLTLGCMSGIIRYPDFDRASGAAILKEFAGEPYQASEREELERLLASDRVKGIAYAKEVFLAGQRREALEAQRTFTNATILGGLCLGAEVEELLQQINGHFNDTAYVLTFWGVQDRKVHEEARAALTRAMDAREKLRALMRKDVWHLHAARAETIQQMIPDRSEVVALANPAGP